MFASMPPPPPPIEHIAHIDNPLLGRADQIRYDKVLAAHFIPAYTQVFASIKKSMDAMVFSEGVSVHDFISTLENFEHPKETIEHVFGLFTGIMDSSDLRDITEEFDTLCIDCDSFIHTHPTMLAFLQHFKSESVFSTLPTSKQRIIDKRYKDLLLEGAFLDEEDKKAFIADQKKLASLKNTFKHNINDSIKQSFVTVYDKEQLAGIPQADIKTASENYRGSSNGDLNANSNEGPWAFGLDAHSIQSILKMAESRDLRKAMFIKTYEAAALPPYANQDTLKALLKIRQSIAHTLGFKNYTAMSLYTKMANTRDDILDLFEPLKQNAQVAHEREIRELQAFAGSTGLDTTLQPWDTAFYAKKLKEKLFSINEEELKAYFSLDRTLTALFDFASSLFNIRIEKQSKQAWHDDVLFYTITDTKGSAIASFYVDPFARTGSKRPGAWMGEFDYKWQAHDKHHLPIAYIVTNIKKPSDDQPCLLSLREVTTLFHEFGHAIQHMLSKGSYKSVSGINGIEWDGVEIASQFMENWIYYKPLLKQLASHYETKASLSEKAIENILKSRQFMQGSSLVNQISFSSLDLELYGNYDSTTSQKAPGSVYFDYLKNRAIPAHPIEHNFPCRFSHIFSGGYSAGYYSYLYAKIMSADLFAAFEEAFLDESHVARLGTLYKETFLELGGSLAPDEVFMLFRAREPNTKAISRHLGL